MQSEELKDELKLISIEENISVKDLKEVVYLVFKFVRNILKTANKNRGYYPAIRVMGLGVFHVTKAKQNKLNKKVTDEKE